MGARLLKPAAHIRDLTSLGQYGLLVGGNLLLERGELLLDPRQIVLEFGQALGLNCRAAVNLCGSSLGCLLLLLGRGRTRLSLCAGLGHLGELLLLSLDVLKNGGQLGLGLIPGPGRLRELLLSRLERLLQGRELSLELVTRLAHLGKLLLGCLECLLQGRELRLRGLSGLGDLRVLALGIGNPGLNISQGSGHAPLLVKLSPHDGFRLLQARGLCLCGLQSA